MHKGLRGAYKLIVGGVLALSAAPAWAGLETYNTLKTTPVGQTRLTWLIWDVYDATFYAKKPQVGTRKAPPYALELTYLRSLNPAQVAAKTVEEMARLGFTDAARLAVWEPQLERMFGEINAGTKLAAVKNADGSTTFIKNASQVAGTIVDPLFGQKFFAIWLSENTLRPDLRRELLNLDAPRTAATTAPTRKVP
jgi:hypothetical protein